MINRNHPKKSQFFWMMLNFLKEWRSNSALWLINDFLVCRLFLVDLQHFWTVKFWAAPKYVILLLEVWVGLLISESFQYSLLMLLFQWLWLFGIIFCNFVVRWLRNNQSYNCLHPAIFHQNESSVFDYILWSDRSMFEIAL